MSERLPEDILSDAVTAWAADAADLGNAMEEVGQAWAAEVDAAEGADLTEGETEIGATAEVTVAPIEPEGS